MSIMQSRLFTKKKKHIITIDPKLSPNNRSNMIKTLCERLAMTPTEIIDAVNTKTKFTFLTSSKPLNIKIKDTISSTELWYHSYRGEV